jgi:methionyl-tRNA formyltransferase
MRIVFFTSDGFESNEVFLYIFAKVTASFHDIHIVAVRRPRYGLLDLYRRKLKRIRRFGSGMTNTLEMIASFPLQRLVVVRNEREARAAIQALPRPPINARSDAAIYVDSVNGPDTKRTLQKLQPDVVIQFNAGILQRHIFEVARIGTLNLHPGIAPLIKGRDPIHWALWDRKPEWLGATIHWIDEGIDTGPVLAYAHLEQRFPGERYPAVFARVYELGIERLVEVLSRLERGERWTIDPPQGEHTYRSNISGFKLALLESRGALARRLSRRKRV